MAQREALVSLSHEFTGRALDDPDRTDYADLDDDDMPGARAIAGGDDRSFPQASPTSISATGGAMGETDAALYRALYRRGSDTEQVEVTPSKLTGTAALAACGVPMR